MLPVRGRARKPPVSEDWLWLVDYAVDRMMKALRYANPGVNVRLPSHIAPPFRSVAYNFQRLDTASATGDQFFIAFNGQTVVPDGVQGVIANVEWVSYPGDTDVNTGFRELELTLFRNSQVVAGWLSKRPGYFDSESITDIAGEQVGGANVASPNAFAPIHLKPDDTLEAVVINNSGLANPQYELRVSGWLYPVEVEADGIIGTMADRGGPMAVPS